MKTFIIGAFLLSLWPPCVHCCASYAPVAGFWVSVRKVIWPAKSVAITMGIGPSYSAKDVIAVSIFW